MLGRLELYRGDGEDRGVAQGEKREGGDERECGEGPEGDALVLVERLDTGTYETRFFLCDGWLVEQYAVAGAPYETDGATWLAETGSFSFELDDGMLMVSCDAGTARTALRSQVEGVAS